MSVIPAKKAVAPLFVIALYIGLANSGNAAAKLDRTKLFDAMAEAACWRYVATKNVITDVKIKMMPDPKGMEAMIGTIHGTEG
jgi:ribose 5-phosphate isomerase